MVISRTKYDISQEDIRRIFVHAGLGEAENIRILGAGEFNSAFAADRFTGGHAFDGLIDILIQRISAIGSYDDIGRWYGYTALLFQEIATVTVGGLHISGKGPDDLFFAVDDHIDDEGKFGFFSGKEHIGMYGVVFQNTGTGKGAVDKFGAVVGHDGLSGSDTGQHTFASSGKTGKEVRFDEAFRDEQVTPDRQTVDAQCAAGWQSAERDHIAVIIGIMDDDFLVIDDILTEFGGQFIFAGFPVTAGGDQDGDIYLRIARPEPPEHFRDNESAGNRPGVVAGDDDTGIFSAGEQFQRR